MYLGGTSQPQQSQFSLEPQVVVGRLFLHPAAPSQAAPLYNAPSTLAPIYQPPAIAPAPSPLKTLPGNSYKFRDIVQEVQFALLAFGYYSGEIDGEMNPELRAGLLRMQRYVCIWRD
ncbi:hypothetical protein EFV37_14740 [Mesorhizobium loti]|uniref:peptidoglycan-binding protein n=1 Tax=Rhizobium loti TaxID=381 RepID=UPI0012BBF408|nr:hypothetical protein EB229_14735 [Mesorhizobium jarvisii]QKD09330.1 hypothetical protein EFV37_14740 [Mesorhizobium loti]